MTYLKRWLFSDVWPFSFCLISVWWAQRIYPSAHVQRLQRFHGTPVRNLRSLEIHSRASAAHWSNIKLNLFFFICLHSLHEHSSSLWFTFFTVLVSDERQTQTNQVSSSSTPVFTYPQPLKEIPAPLPDHLKAHFGKLQLVRRQWLTFTYNHGEGEGSRQRGRHRSRWQR